MVLRVKRAVVSPRTVWLVCVATCLLAIQGVAWGQLWCADWPCTGGCCDAIVNTWNECGHYNGSCCQVLRVDHTCSAPAGCTNNCTCTYYCVSRKVTLSPGYFICHAETTGKCTQE